MKKKTTRKVSATRTKSEPDLLAGTWTSMWSGPEGTVIVDGQGVLWFIDSTAARRIYPA